MDNKPLKATKQSTCFKCNKLILPGDSITKDEATGRYVHAGCKGQTQTSAQGGQGAAARPVANPPPTFSVKENLERAVEDLKVINGGEASSLSRHPETRGRNRRDHARALLAPYLGTHPKVEGEEHRERERIIGDWMNPKLIFEYEHLPKMEQVRTYIRECEGKHVQQAIYSTFHDALTQVCFGCLKVRSTIRR